MSEQPFVHGEEEDDIVHEYDVRVFRSTCLQQRSVLEKTLLAISVVCFVVIISLSVALSRKPSPIAKRICSSVGCVRASESVMSAMDPTVSPCEDFYAYACGAWVRETPIPPGYTSWDRFQELADKNLHVLKTLMDAKDFQNSAEQKANTLYRSCLSEDLQDSESTINAFRDTIAGVGGWGIQGESVKNQSWEFQNAIIHIHRLSAWPLFQPSVDVDDKNTMRYILKIDTGYLGMKPSFYGTDTGEKLFRKVVSGYIRKLTKMAQVLIPEKQNSTQTALDIFNFEQRLAAIWPSMEAREDREKLYNLMTIGDLEKQIPLLNWTKYINQVMEGSGTKITKTEDVIVNYPTYMHKLSSLVHNYSSDPELQRTLRNYMVMSLVQSLSHYYNKAIFEDDLFEDENSAEDWRRCMYYTNQAMGFATGAIYVRGHKHESSLEKIEELIKYIKNAFKNYILKKYWMDDETVKSAAAKTDAIIDKVNYPKHIGNSTFLESFYSMLNVSSQSWFKNIMQWKAFERNKLFSQLRQKPDRTRWLSPPVTVNGVYTPYRNELFFPAAMFHLPFYNQGGPYSFNFGAAGSAIGHEITHAFDVIGRQYDQDGLLRSWWDKQTSDKFDVTTPCFVHQYNAYEMSGQKVDGKQTLQENIADNGGLRAAHMAYLWWQQEHMDEGPLPGLNITHNQLFFISFAQMYCSKYTDTGLEDHLLNDRHSPGKFRVNGAVSNSKSFSDTFQCSSMSAMNPRVTCEVW